MPKGNLNTSNFGKDTTAGRVPIQHSQGHISDFMKQNVKAVPTFHVVNKRNNAEQKLLTFETSLKYKNSH